MDGKTLGPYFIEHEVGSGGMGTVYRARVERHAAGRQTGEHVALKVVHPHLLEQEGYFKRFLKEADLGKRVDHGNVVRTYDADAITHEGKQLNFLVMEFVEGQTLRSLLKELAQVPEELCRHIGREVAQALEAIHGAGFVHRDLKPENVLITPDHQVKVMDLGVARLKDEAIRLSRTGAFVGSVLYGAPEQFRDGGEAVDGRADLYALGLTLYELATGRHPFEHDDLKVAIRRQLTEEPRSPAELNPQISPFFEEVVKTLLVKDPAGRFATAAALAKVLSEAEESSWWKERARAIRSKTRRPLRRIRIPRETALYGREQELQRLRTLYERAKAGEGRVVLVEGEAGIGKSRLVDEFVGTLQREGEDLNFLFGSYPPAGAATASGAFSTAYREQFGEEGIEETLGEYLKPTPILIAAFAALLRGEPAQEGKEPLTKDSLQTVFVHATRALAAERPTVVLVDDLHFSPEEGRALFASLALAIPGHRVLLVGTFRPGVEEKWLGGLERLDHVARLPLPRLGAKDLVRLLGDAFHSDALAEGLCGKIAVKSDGNPYFVFEILRGLREGQFLTQKQDGTWVTTRVIEDIQVPSSVLDLVAARVADLRPEERDLLDVASCCGFEFDPLLVAAASGMARIPALKVLAQIERAHRLVRSSGRRFAFDHHQVQEALYASLPEALREEYHAAVAEAMESRVGAVERDPKTLDGALCVDLTEHLLKGARWDRALRYLDAALVHLERGYLNDRAAMLATRALDVSGLLAGRERVEVLLRKVRRLDLLGRRAEERAALEEARDLAGAGGDAALRARVLVALGRYRQRTSDYDGATAVLEEAMALAESAGDRESAANATNVLGTVFRELSQYDKARTHFERYLAFAIETGDVGAETVATSGLGNVSYDQSRNPEALVHHERSLVLARQCENRLRESASTVNLGTVFQALGRFEEARTHFERGLAMAREIGAREFEAFATSNLGNLFDDLGRYDEARAQLERAISLAREMAIRNFEASSMAVLGGTLHSLGDLRAARATTDRALFLSHEVGDRRTEGYGLLVLAHLEASEDRADGAEAGFRKAIDLHDSIGNRSGGEHGRASLGALLAASGRAEEARPLLEAASAAAIEIGTPRLEVLALAHLATLTDGYVGAAVDALGRHGTRVDVQTRMEARLALFRATREPAHLAEAKRLLDDILALAPPERRDAMLANVRLHREIVAAWKEPGTDRAK